MKSKTLFGLPAAVILCALAVAPAEATPIPWTATGSSTDGTLDAEAVFTITTGQIQVTLTNLLNPATIKSAGQTLSEISFTLSNTPGYTRDLHGQWSTGEPRNWRSRNRRVRGAEPVD